MIVPLPAEVKQIYAAVDALEKRYPGRKFTPDGHLVGSIGEVIAAEMFGLELLPMSAKVHDAIDPSGRQVQIKLTSKSAFAMNGPCERLIVLQIVDSESARLVFDCDGTLARDNAGPKQKNGQRRISFEKLRKI